MADPVAKSTAPVPVVDKYDTYGTLDPSEVDAAIQSGQYRLATPDEIAKTNAELNFGAGPKDQLKAFTAGVGRGASFGTSDVAATVSGAVSPETLKGLQVANPWSSGIGEAAGVGLSLFNPYTPVAGAAKLGQLVGKAAVPAAEGIAGALANKTVSPIVNRIVSKAVSAGAGSAVEGALYGAGNAVSEQALGDPGEVGEKLMANMGYGALVGGGLGAALGGTAGLLKKTATPELEAQATKNAIAKDAASTNAALDQGAIETPQGNPFEKIQEKVKNANLEYMPKENLPARATLQDATNNVPDMEFKPLPIQYEALENPQARDIYSTFKESQSPEAVALQNYEALQKGEALYKTKKTIQDLAPNYTATSDAVKGGEHAIEAFTDQYQAEKKALEPTFNQIDQAGLNTIENRKDLLTSLEKAIPGATKYIESAEDGIKLAKYSPSMPFTQESYGEIKNLVNAINEKDLTLGGLRNIRDNMADKVNFLTGGKTSSQVGALRREIMSFMEDEINKTQPDLGVKDAFKRYAINEQARTDIEKIFGGSVSDKASFGKGIVSENVLDKIFSNTNTVARAKELLGPQKFNEIAANYLSQNVKAATDPTRNGFSSSKFYNFLNRNENELAQAFAEKPEVLKRMKSLTEIMRILPDAPSSNPSGTAKTLSILKIVSGIGNLLNPTHIPGSVGGGLQKLSQKLENAKLKDVIGGMIEGRSLDEAEKASENSMAATSILAFLERSAQKTTNLAKSAAKAIFQGAEYAGKNLSTYAAGAIGSEMKEKHQEVSDKLQSMNSSYDKMADTINKMTKPLHSVAPSISGQTQQAAVRASQFLQSKLPMLQNNSKLLSKPPEPSTTEIAKFNRYHDIVENPIIALHQVKDGSLTPETIETLNVVYPKLYSEMKSHVIDNLSNSFKKKEELPYSKKMSLSLFLGQDLVDSLDPHAIISNQQAMNPNPQESGPAEQGSVKPTQKGLASITKSKSMLTPLQATAEREEA